MKKEKILLIICLFFILLIGCFGTIYYFKESKVNKPTDDHLVDLVLKEKIFQESDGQYILILKGENIEIKKNVGKPFFNSIEEGLIFKYNRA